MYRIAYRQVGEDWRGFPDEMEHEYQATTVRFSVTSLGFEARVCLPEEWEELAIPAERIDYPKGWKGKDG